MSTSSFESCDWSDETSSLGSSCSWSTNADCEAYAGIATSSTISPVSDWTPSPTKSPSVACSTPANSALSQKERHHEVQTSPLDRAHEFQK